jgi:hypothetical protein
VGPTAAAVAEGNTTTVQKEEGRKRKQMRRRTKRVQNAGIYKERRHARATKSNTKLNYLLIIFILNLVTLARQERRLATAERGRKEAELCYAQHILAGRRN